jgi:hypothetical protein
MTSKHPPGPLLTVEIAIFSGIFRFDLRFDVRRGQRISAEKARRRAAPSEIPPLTSDVRISNDVRRYKSVPDEQHHDGADDGGDETSTSGQTRPTSIRCDSSAEVEWDAACRQDYDHPAAELKGRDHRPSARQVGVARRREPIVLVTGRSAASGATPLAREVSLMRVAFGSGGRRILATRFG